MVRLLIKSIGNIISCIVVVDPSSLRYASCTVGNSSNWKDKLQVDWWGKVLRIVRRRVASRHNWLRALTVKVERCTHQCKSESCSLHSPANQHTTSLHPGRVSGDWVGLSVQHEALPLTWRAGNKLILYIKVSPPGAVIRRKLPMKCFISAFISIEIGKLAFYLLPVRNYQTIAILCHLMGKRWLARFVLYSAETMKNEAPAFKSFENVTALDIRWAIAEKSNNRLIIKCFTKWYFYSVLEVNCKILLAVMKFFLVINQLPTSCKAIEKVALKGLRCASRLHLLDLLLPDGKPRQDCSMNLQNLNILRFCSSGLNGSFHRTVIKPGKGRRRRG